MADMERMKELTERLNAAAKAYYQEDREILSNQEYDSLYDELAALEERTGTVLASSPTQKVGYTVLSSLEKVRHESPILSLDKTKETGKLESFLGDKTGILSWKLDGLTIVLKYRGGILEQAVTRGNGEVGEDVTHNARVFQNIPLTIPFSGELVLRGEGVIPYSEFRRINDALDDDEKYKNLLQDYIVAADNFVVFRPTFRLHTLIAGYPWFLDWARDSLISFEGLLLITKRYEIAKEVLLTLIRDIKFGLVPNGYSGFDLRPLYNSADSSLLLFEAVYKYLKYTNDMTFVKGIYSRLKTIIKSYKEGIDLDNNNIYLDEKIIVHGFSASAKFANRFSILHPELVKLVIAGGLGGTLILPLRNIDNEKLLYPVGVGNFSEITDEKIKKFIAIKQFYYQGKKDEIDAFQRVDDNGFIPYYKGIINSDELKQIYKYLGKDINTRWENTQEIYNELCSNVILRTYENGEHNLNEAVEDIKKLLEDEVK